MSEELGPHSESFQIWLWPIYGLGVFLLLAGIAWLKNKLVCRSCEYWLRNERRPQTTLTKEGCCPSCGKLWLGPIYDRSGL
jgi:hypothetical protein